MARQPCGPWPRAARRPSRNATKPELRGSIFQTAVARCYTLPPRRQPKQNQRNATLSRDNLRAENSELKDGLATLLGAAPQDRSAPDRHDAK